MNPEARCGPKNLQNILKFFCKLSEDVFSIVKPVAQRNAYFAHPENIFIAMINDERSYIRELWWRRILKVRRSNSNGIHQFNIPQLLFASKHYVNMIYWQENDITEPPLYKKLTDKEIENNMKLKIPISFLALPCHIQAVE